MDIFTMHLSYDKPLVINIPGYGGTPTGYEDKYIKIAKMLQDKDLASFFSVDNSFDANDMFHREYYTQRMLQKLSPLFEAVRIGKHKEVYLMGTSAGASIIPILTEMYPEIITKILLTAPSENTPLELSIPAIKKFKGEVSIIVGNDDNIVGIEPAAYLYAASLNASMTQMVTIPNCDHNFSGEYNGRLFSAAVLWAFDNEHYPDLDAEIGIKLYE